MPTWEYLHIMVTYWLGNRMVYSENGHEDKCDSIPLADILNKQGALGWELVSVTYDDRYWGLFFKRPIN
jgi:hypothetical protein